MIGSRAVRVFTKILSPVVYAASVVLAALFTLGAWSRISSLPDQALSLIIALAPTFLLIGGITFGVCAWGLLLLERLQRPKVLDHLRRCALLYPFVVLLGPLVFAFYDDDPGAGYSIAFDAFIFSTYAVLVDALILLLKRRRLINSSVEGAA